MGQPGSRWQGLSSCLDTHLCPAIGPLGMPIHWAILEVCSLREALGSGWLRWPLHWVIRPVGWDSHLLIRPVHWAISEACPLEEALWSGWLRLGGHSIGHCRGSSVGSLGRPLHCAIEALSLGHLRDSSVGPGWLSCLQKCRPWVCHHCCQF